MADLIDRQAALEELAVYIHLIDKTMGKGLLTDDDCMEAAKSVLGEDELPAVQPATNCSEIPNSSDDTISRQAAIDAITDELMPSTPLSAVIRAKNRLKELPAVQPDHTADSGKKVCVDTISRQAALDAIMGQPPEPHYPAWYAAQIEKLPAVQPDHNADVSKRVDVDDCISRRHVIDAMKDMYRAAEKWLRDATDDVTKARAESCMASLVEIKLRTEKLPAVQPDHVADISKKVEQTGETAQNVQNEDLISRKWLMECIEEGWVKFDTAKDCNRMMHLVRDIAPSVQPEQNAQDEDLISRKAAIEALARMMPRSYTPDGSHPADEEIFRAQEVFADCIEALEILPSAQPDNQTNLCDSCDCSYPDCPSKYDDVIFGNGIGNDNICACNKYKPSAQPEQRWIPVEERLPAVPWCRCLITRDDGRGGVTVEEALFSFGRWYDNKYLEDGRNRKFDISASVIAWAPFPAPYRGGDT